MKVLFVSSGNGKYGISSFIKIQAESLKRENINIDFFPVQGKGIKGYIKSGLELKKYLKEHSYDLIHAHYTLSGWSAVIGSGKIPVILSLMGSDAYGDIIAPNKSTLKSKYITLLTYLIQPFVKKLISKSANIEKYVWQKRKSIIIPNGINIEKFKPAGKDYKKELGLDKDKQYALFLGKNESVRKNYKLTEKAISYLNNNNVKFLNPYPLSHEQIPKYLNAVDVLIHPSLAEGSPNLVKEAMACNCPVVSTNVGDVEWLFGNEPGHYLTIFEPEDVAKKIEQALEFARMQGRTNGRQRIMELGLDAGSVARRLIKVYEEVLDERRRK